MVGTTAPEHETLLQDAEELAAAGNYKDAYNVLARGPWRGGAEDQLFRHRRGVYAYKVAHERLDQFERSQPSKTMLIKAGCWLARASAYLASAAEDASESDRTALEEKLRHAQQDADRFRELCREYAVDLFISPDDDASDD